MEKMAEDSAKEGELGHSPSPAFNKGGGGEGEVRTSEMMTSRRAELISRTGRQRLIVDAQYRSVGGEELKSFIWKMMDHGRGNYRARLLNRQQYGAR
ncbi:hypothetical protein TNCT_563771 [Trichonephila clavata]|uniref:Uncharacterized protein n=1 Tax=Trichonephila clavata TaxID=2740835 RepID=A0A8X6HBQ3_TRICU|nr:hypothetical protein TNCT_563771 [Trichonephila clavata]